MKDGGYWHLPPLTDDEVAAYLDENPDAALRAALDRRLDANPRQRVMIERIHMAEEDLRAQLDAMLDEPVPGHLLALLDDSDGPSAEPTDAPTKYRGDAPPTTQGSPPEGKARWPLAALDALVRRARVL